MQVTLLAGGTGAAKLAVGFQGELPPGRLTVIANTADDVEVWGLRICPDTDAVLYRLAGIFNREAGFGVAGDTFNLHRQMAELGEEDWFWLGDRDLAFHLLRTAMLRRGARLTETALELGRRLGLATRVLPMSDDEVRTCFETEAGRLGFQEYYVRERLRPRLRSLDLHGIEVARPAPEAVAAVESADLVVIGPSNPLVSIGPITALLGRHLRRERTLAVSPIVGGRALKGPTVEMMRVLRGEASPERVAEEYRALAGWFVVDEVDSARAPAIASLGYRVLVTDTVMPDDRAARRLAAAILRFWRSGRG
ncbi:MAG TPA: 2-phospho-L-lactate transferase [Candidatus Dormibacteraeota bacterium]|nr:2-phospho-L-lactate transferase [Candidatus Dormibacteraeota bacterium]